VLSVRLPAGPPEALVSTDRDGGTLLMAFLGLALAGALLAAYHLGWWLQNEPRPAGALLVAAPFLLLLVATLEAIHRGSMPLAISLSAPLCALLAIGVNLIVASDRSPLGLLVVLSPVLGLAVLSQHRSPTPLIWRTALIAASVPFIGVGIYELTPGYPARLVAGASGMTIAVASALGAGGLLLANAHRERLRARFDRALQAWLAEVQAEGDDQAA
jgi:hypothetical protein